MKILIQILNFLLVADALSVRFSMDGYIMNKPSFVAINVKGWLLIFFEELMCSRERRQGVVELTNRQLFRFESL